MELGGNGVFYSLNYDRMLVVKEKWKVAGRAGISYFNDHIFFKETNPRNLYTFPLEVSYLRGKQNHYLELGLGITPGFESYPESSFENENKPETPFTVRIGYRYQKRQGGFFLKTGFTPFFTIYSKSERQQHNSKGNLMPFLGLALGYTLKR